MKKVANHTTRVAFNKNGTSRQHTGRGNSSRRTTGSQKTRVVKFAQKASPLRARIIKAVEAVAKAREAAQAN